MCETSLEAFWTIESWNVRGLVAFRDTFLIVHIYRRLFHFRRNVPESRVDSRKFKIAPPSVETTGRRARARSRARTASVGIPLEFARGSESRRFAGGLARAGRTAPRHQGRERPLGRDRPRAPDGLRPLPSVFEMMCVGRLVETRRDARTIGSRTWHRELAQIVCGLCGSRRNTTLRVGRVSWPRDDRETQSLPSWGQGLSKILTANAKKVGKRASFAGTLEYMSPEMLTEQDGKMPFLLDWWSLGASRPPSSPSRERESSHRRRRARRGLRVSIALALYPTEFRISTPPPQVLLVEAARDPSGNTHTSATGTIRIRDRNPA